MRLGMIHTVPASVALDGRSILMLDGNVTLLYSRYAVGAIKQRKHASASNFLSDTPLPGTLDTE